MAFHMQRKMIWSGECSFTQPTLKWPVTCVFSVMSRQFITSCEFPATTLCCANVWLFSRVCPLVCFHMAWFGVCLGTTILWTLMNYLFTLWCFSFSWFGNFTCCSRENLEFVDLCFVHPIFLSFCFWYFGHFSWVTFFFSILPILSCKMYTKITLYFRIFITSSPRLTKNQKSKNGMNKILGYFLR